MKSPRLLLAVFVLPSLLVCGCGQDEPLRNYTTDPTTRPVVFNTPDGWHRVGARRNFEELSAWETYEGRERARISVSYLSTDEPDMLENITRWRRQVGLTTEITEAEMELAFQKREVDGQTLRYVELLSPPDHAQPSAIWGAIFIAKKKTWFLKFRGPVALAQRQKATFEQWMPDAYRAIMSAVREPIEEDPEEASDGY